MSRLFKSKTLAESKPANPEQKPLTQSQREELMKKNWGTEAYKTVKRFRKIWDQEGAKLVP